MRIPKDGAMPKAMDQQFGGQAGRQPGAGRGIVGDAFGSEDSGRVLLTCEHGKPFQDCQWRTVVT